MAETELGIRLELSFKLPTRHGGKLYLQGTNTPEHSAMFEVIGRIVVLWTRVEYAVEGLVDWLHVPAIANEFPRKFRHRPEGLRAQREFLDLAFREIDVLQEYVPELRKFESWLKRLGSRRNEIIHATRKGIVTTPEGLRLHIRASRKSGQTERMLTLDDLDQIATEIGNLGMMAFLFASSVQGSARAKWIAKQAAVTSR